MAFTVSETALDALELELGVDAVEIFIIGDEPAIEHTADETESSPSVGAHWPKEPLFESKSELGWSLG